VEGNEEVNILYNLNVEYSLGS